MINLRKSLKITANFLHIFVLLFYFATFLPSKVIAQTRDCDEELLRNLGVIVVSCDGFVVECSAPTTNGTTSSPPIANSSKIYVLGDSLTVGMKTLGLEDAITENGWVATKINAVGGKDIDWGTEQLEPDRDFIEDSTVAIIGLGTNEVGTVVNSSGPKPSGVETVKQKILNLTSTLRSINPSIQIYWTDVYVTGTLNTGYGTFPLDTARDQLNQAINEASLPTSTADRNYYINPWSTSEVAKQTVQYDAVDDSKDGIHPNGQYAQMVDWLMGTMRAGTVPNTSSANGCSCSTGSLPGTLDRDARYRNTFAFFLSKGLTEEVTAGVMGNLEAESGIDPHNVQNSANAKGIPDGPEIPIDAVASDGTTFEGSYGYGIAQWTSSGRQRNLIAYATETNRSTGALDLQLDFLWKELNESYLGVISVLQTPGATLDEASYVFLSEFEIPLPFTDRGTEAQRIAETENRRSKSQAIYDEFAGTVNPGSPSSSGCSSTGAPIDLVSEDTSSVPCPAELTDKGVTNGYRDGETIIIRLCDVYGASVNSQLAGSLKQMIDDAAANGVSIGINGAFRSMDGQISIYNSWCATGGLTPTPPPYPKENWSDYQRCPGAAPPGYSNHQAGFAVDLMCNGTLIPKSFAEASTNACYIWLVDNAVRYGLYEYGKGDADSRTSAGYEGWHWSVDGS